MNHRTALVIAGLLGATGVGLGAFGAHGLRDLLLQRGTSIAWDTAVRYHLLHAVALIALAVYLRQATGTARARARWAASCWVVGTLVFSGSLYYIALGGPRWLGPVTPLGGLALVAGWLLVTVAALGKEE